MRDTDFDSTAFVDHSDMDYDTETRRLVFADPVAYLARFGIEATMVADLPMPAAA